MILWDPRLSDSQNDRPSHVKGSAESATVGRIRARFKQFASAMSSCRVLALISAIVSLNLPAGAQSSVPNGSSQAEKALSLVERYLALEQASADERLKIRGEMLEFSFRTTRENGSQRVLSEREWRTWEMGRTAAVQRVQLIGEPTVERVRDDLLRVHCALHLNRSENGKNWEGVSLRNFDVLVREGQPRIRHERLLALREGIKPGQWKKMRKKDNGSRSNLRSSPTSAKDNIVGKLESNELVYVWDQQSERWLFVRTAKGLVGFIHRSQIDFSVAPEETGTTPLNQSLKEIRQKKDHPFALVLPGKAGYVLNPYTNSIVDVRGLRAGTLVRDPRDPVKTRAFRVPFYGSAGRAVIVKED